MVLACLVSTSLNLTKGVIFIHTIAICDDDPVFLSNLVNETKLFFSKYSEPVDIHSFPNGEAFFATLTAFPYQLIMLDIDMPGKSGIDISKLLRSQNINAEILFISNHESYVFESFCCQPLRFIRKDHIHEELHEALEAYCEIKHRTEQFYTFKTVNKDLVIPIKDIMYLEVYTHTLTVHCVHDEFQMRKTLNFFENELSGYGFIRIHKSFLVSYRYIYSINPNSVLLTTQIELPISRGKNAFIKEQYMLYFRELN